MGMQAVGESLRIERPVGEVWRAWTDPVWLTGWHAERLEGELAPGAVIQLHWDSLGISIELEVVTVRAPDRLVLRGAPPGRPPQTLTVTLAAVEGGTELAIRHEGLASEEERAGTAAGWRVAARVLAHYLAHHAGRPRRCAAALAPVAASLADIEPFLARPRWLFGEELAPLGEEGGRFAGGTVLASALPREIALAVDGGAGVVVLRAIRLDPGAALVGAQAWSWHPDRPAHAALVAELQPSVERLVAELGGSHGGAA